MSAGWVAGILITPMALILIWKIVDRWHQRRAWKRAGITARRELDRRDRMK